VPDRPPANFIADSLGLDFLNSIATPVDQPVDWLDGGDGLVAWLAQANLVPPRALNAVTERAAPGELDKVAAQAVPCASGSGASCASIWAGHSPQERYVNWGP
jgi:Putative stress-induced transcription regulator